MDRRAFLITSGGAAVAAASATGGHAEPAQQPLPALKADATVLRLAMAWPDAPQGPGDDVRRLARHITTMTDGRFGFDIVAADAPDADLTHGPAHDFAAQHPAFAYFAGLPGASGVPADDLASWLAVGGGQMLWDELAAEHGWAPLLAGHSGEQPPLWSTAPLTTLGDLAGARVCLPGLGADVARALGAEPHSAAPDKVASALEAGHLAAAEAGGLLASLGSGLARIARHATGDGVNRHGTAFALSVRLPVWQKLSPADRAIFAAAAAEAFHLSVAESRAHAQIARQVLATAFGVRFEAWPQDVAEAIDRVAEATVAHVAGYDAVATRIDRSFMAFRAALHGVPPPERVVPLA